MKRIFFSLTTIVALLSTLIACNEVDQPTVTHKMIRVATVAKNNSKAYLSFDYTGESYNIDNFKNEADFDDFKVKEGDRVFAFMTLKAVGSYLNSTITLDSLLKAEVIHISKTKPSPEMDSYYKFAVMELAGLELVGKESYPAIWSNGHVVCVAPQYFQPAGQPVPSFEIYPDSMKSDTLTMTLYATIPGNDISLNPYYSQVLLNFDLSELREQVTDPAEQAKRDTILARMDRLGKNKINVQISTLDVLYAENSKNLSSPQYIHPVKTSKTTQIDFDF